MTTDNIIQIIGTIISAGLWLLTYLNFRNICKQNDNMVKTTNTETIYKIIQSHQNIFLSLLQNDEYIKLVSNDGDIEKRESEIIGTLLVNHCSVVFDYAKNKLIDEDTFLGMENDIAQIFKWNVVKNRWNDIQQYYSSDFQDFIENVSEKGRRNTLSSKK